MESIKQANIGTLGETLGINVTYLGYDKVEATMPVNEKTRQPMGLLHGGASVALAETVASIGGWYHVAEKGQVVVGQEINANHLRPVRDGFVKAVGMPIHLGKTSQVWEIKIFHDDVLSCISRCTLAVIKA